VNVTNGQVDVNDGGTITAHGVAFTGTMTGPDAFGWGTFGGSLQQMPQAGAAVVKKAAKPAAKKKK